MTFVSRPSVVILSRGGTWNPRPWDPPYTLPTDVVGGKWPNGATAVAIFYDTAGNPITTVAGTVNPDGITFLATPDIVDPIPNGANFEIQLSADHTYQIRYGKVIRREPF